MTARRPADIAADLRANWGMPRRIVLLADELDALHARWLTADETAEARAIAKRVEWASPSDGTALADFLDRLDPPQPEPQVTLTVPISVATEVAESITYWQVGVLRDALQPTARAALEARS